MAGEAERSFLGLAGWRAALLDRSELDESERCIGTGAITLELALELGFEGGAAGSEGG